MENEAMDQRGDETFRVVTLQMVVPARFADHMATQIRWRMEDEGIAVRSEIGLPAQEHLDHAQQDMWYEDDRFTIGQWVGLREDHIHHEHDRRPDFVTGTVGKIAGYRRGYRHPWLVKVPVPVFEKDGTEWMEDDDRPFIGYYYNWHELEEIDSLDRIPEKHREGAVLWRKPEKRQLTPEQIEEQSLLTKEIVEELLREEQEEKILRVAPVIGRR